MSARPFTDAELCAAIPGLRRAAMAMARHTADAEDLVQDTLTNALRYAAQFEAGTNLAAWLNRILRNRFLTGMRVRRVQVDLADAAMDPRMSMAPRQVAIIEAQDALAAVARLPAAHRDVMRTVVLDGDEYADVAARTGVPQGTLKCRVFAARNAIRRGSTLPDRPRTPAGRASGKDRRAERNARVLAWLAEGRTDRQCAVALSVSVFTIRNIRLAAGVVLPRGRTTPDARMGAVLRQLQRLGVQVPA